MLRHKLTLLRDRFTPTSLFRQVAREVALLMAYEVTRDLPLQPIDIETPLESMRAEHLSGKKLCIVSILRAGNGILEGMLDLVPSARAGHIGLYRDPKTLQPVEYYLKLPTDIAERLVILVDPMLATGNSATAAATRLKQAGVTRDEVPVLAGGPGRYRGLYRRRIRRCRYSPARSTGNSTNMGISGQDWATRAIGFTGRNNPKVPSPPWGGGGQQGFC